MWFQCCVGGEIKRIIKRWKWLSVHSVFFSVFWSPEQLQKKLNQLEEQLDNEMQAKDELDNKCKYDTQSFSHCF